jgi:hypothetical protein
LDEKEENMKLNQLTFGNNDGKKEAKLVIDFDKYFYDPNGLYDLMKKPARFLILGRKGSGKTILAYYFKKKITIEDELNITKIIGLKNANYSQLLNVPVNENDPNQYYTIWKWILLVSYSNLLLSYQFESFTASYSQLYDFIFKELKLGKISFEKLIEKSSKATYEVSASFLKADYENQTKKIPVTYEELIDPLFNLVLNTASSINSNITLIIDEIDDKYRTNSKNKNLLISLIKAADEINTELLDYNDKCKIMLLVRTDIYQTLIDSDLEKIKQDSSVKLDWKTRFDYKSPVFLLALNKIKASIPDLQDKSYKYIYDNYFYGSIDESDDADPAKYILNRTMIRPRDIITYFNFIISDFPDSETITLDMIKSAEGKYSEYLVGEVKNELISHFDEDYINSIMFLIKTTRREYFHKRDFVESMKRKTGNIKEYDIPQILTDMYEFGLIGYQTEDILGNANYCFKYRDTASPFLLDVTFVIHPGLRKELLR